jgi:hypothetical protein
MPVRDVIPVPQVIIVRPWSAGGRRHGGWRRSRQIEELLAAAGTAFDVGTTLPAARVDVRGVPHLLRAGPRAWNRANFLDAVSRSRSLHTALGDGRSVLVEMPHNPVIERLTAARCPVRIALPQNIEAFNESAGRSSWPRDRGSKAAAEVRVLSRYDAVFTIAVEEYWLLNNVGIEAHFLPYSPPQEVATWLQCVRSTRLSRAPDDNDEVVVMGTAQARHADATVKLVRTLRSAGLRPVLVGYGTPSLRSRIGEQANLLGEISEDHLQALLARCRAVAIFQHGGGGALTRIVDLGHAGVPVVAAGVAARSMYGWQHLTWVQDVGAVPDALPAPGTTIRAADPWETLRLASTRRLLSWLAG